MLAFLTCNIVFAASENSIKTKYFQKKLDAAEGIWVDHKGRVFAIIKEDNSFKSIIINHKHYENGSTHIRLNGADGVYYGTTDWPNNYGRIKKNCRAQFFVSGLLGVFKISGCWSKDGSVRNFTKAWPVKLISHNNKFESEDNNEFQASSGTAFFINKNGYLITNHHVIRKCKNRSKIIYKDNTYNAKLIAKDKYLDLALLKSDLNNTKYLSLSNKAPKKLQRIITAGYPLGKELSDDLKFTSGIISSLKGLKDDSTRLQIDAALNYGNSGGPIVDEITGDLLAVAVAGLDKQVTESINFGIKAGSVKNFLEANQVRFNLNSKNTNSSNIDIALTLENSTVYTYCD